MIPFVADHKQHRHWELHGLSYQNAIRGILVEIAGVLGLALTGFLIALLVMRLNHT